MVLACTTMGFIQDMFRHEQVELQGRVMRFESSLRWGESPSLVSLQLFHFSEEI